MNPIAPILIALGGGNYALAHHIVAFEPGPGNETKVVTTEGTRYSTTRAPAEIAADILAGLQAANATAQTVTPAPQPAPAPQPEPQPTPNTPAQSRGIFPAELFPILVELLGAACGVEIAHGFNVVSTDDPEAAPVDAPADTTAEAPADAPAEAPVDAPTTEQA